MVIRLLMLSGGFDSTAGLVKLLTETKEDVWCHHVVLKNHERRNEAETQAVNSIVKYCRDNYRPFKFSTSEFSYHDTYFPGWDVLTIGYIATIAATALQNRVLEAWGDYVDVEVVFGINKDDVDFIAHRKEKMESVFKSAFLDYETLGIPEPTISYIVSDMTKRDIVEYIPEDLRKLVWSCRTPQKVDTDFVECGNCVSCKMLKEVSDVR